MQKIKMLRQFIILLTLIGVSCVWGKTPVYISPQTEHSAQLRLVDSLLANHHYNSEVFNDEKSIEVLDNYIEYLDYGKYLFTQADIDRFMLYKESLDDYSHQGDLTAVFDMYNKYIEKMDQRAEWVLKRLERTFDKNSNEEINLDRETVSWAQTEAELDKRWEKRLQNEWLGLMLAQKEDKEAREMLSKRYKNIITQLNQTKPDDVFQTYLNAVTTAYDPHTTYFSPRTGENFQINMKLSLEGIGAQLSIEDELVTIKKLIVGGPAIKSGKLDEEDKIIGVGQDTDGEIIDVVGWRLDDVVDKIRGPRGTTIRLLIQKNINDEVKEVVLVRDKIKLEEQAAKSEIKTINKAGREVKIGVIDIPSFYIDFEGVSNHKKDYRSTTRDVKKLIVELQKEGIEGLLIDLRNNGGGALLEAIQMTGLFIDKGPVVQVQDSKNKLEVQEDTDAEIFYNGPLGVLINNNSASASEIFAGAIKDYHRGVILGSTSYGKGTVQTIIDLANLLPGIEGKTGQLKMTMAMFYRINGSSTQIKGVEPDIFIPAKEVIKPAGESEESHALAWREIEPAPSQDNHKNFDVGKLKSSYDARATNNEGLKTLNEYLQWFNEKSENKVLSLNYERRKQQRTEHKAEDLAFKNRLRKLYGYPALTAEYLDKEDKDKSKAEKDAEKDEKTDVILDNASEVVADMVVINL